MEKLVTSIEQIEYHRNGVGGIGFSVVLFKSEGESMIAFVFDEPGCVAVMRRDDIAEGRISMGEGAAFRGDHFEDELRKAIEKDFDSWVPTK